MRFAELSGRSSRDWLISPCRICKIESLRTAPRLFGMPEFHRRLPHHDHDPQGKWLLCHLHGSFPHAKYPPSGKMNSGAAFVWMGRYLDSTRTGPMYLAQKTVARVVVGSLQRGVLLAAMIWRPMRSRRIACTCCCRRSHHPGCCNPCGERRQRRQIALWAAPGRGFGKPK